MLILPGNPLFNLTLSTAPPPNWRETAANHGTFAFVAEPGSGLMRPASPDELQDYLEGGEYEERLRETGDEWEDED
jgi:hypothetical protein